MSAIDGSQVRLRDGYRFSVQLPARPEAHFYRRAEQEHHQAGTQHIIR